MHFQTDDKILCGSYMRLSREDGDKLESNSIRNQKDLISDFCKKHPEMIRVDEYVDDGYTGTNYDRPGFKRMMEDAQNGKINCIVVKDLSRLGRNHIETGRYMEQIFPAMGIRFIAVNDNYDSADESRDSDQIIVPFRNLINDAYCRDISMKVRSQLEVKRKNGKFTGSFAGYGYSKDPKDKHHLVIDEYAAGIVKSVYEWRLDGMSLQRISERLNRMGVLPPMEYKRSCSMNYNCGFRASEDEKWSAVSVRRILLNEMYTGTMIQGKRRKVNYKVGKIVNVPEEDWIRVEGTHEAIIPRTMYDKVQQLWEFDTCTPPGKETVNMFSGILRCGDCGHNMGRRTSSRKNKKYFYYYCTTYRNGEGCSSHLINEQKLTDAVLKAIQDQVKLVVEAENIIMAAEELPEKSFGVKNVDGQIAALEAETERYQDLKEKLFADKADGIVSREEFREINDWFTKKMRDAREKKAELEKKRKQLMAENKPIQPWLEEFCRYRNINHLDRRVLISLVDRIYVYGRDSIEIRFKFEDEIKELLESAGKEYSPAGERRTVL